MTRRVFPVALAILLALPDAAVAQRELPFGSPGPFLRVDVAKPLFAGALRESHVASSVWDASVVVPIRGTLALFAQVAASVGQIEGRGWSGTVSNPRLGAAIGRSRGLHGVVQIGLPISHELGDGYATGVGRYTDFEELERIAPEVLSSSCRTSEDIPSTFIWRTRAAVTPSTPGT
jgi:hypothetical protein